MLQQDVPEDLVIATGTQHSVRDFVNAAASQIGLALTWRGEGLDEQALDSEGKCVVAVDPRYFRPTEVETLLGDPAKAKARLGWSPKTSFLDLVAEMAREDLALAERDRLLSRHGFPSFGGRE